MSIRNLAYQVYQKNFINYCLYLAVCCCFGSAEPMNYDFDNYSNFYCHCLTFSCKFLFLALCQTVFCILSCHDLLLFPYRAGWSLVEVCLFLHFSFLDFVEHFKSSCLWFAVEFDSYEPKLGTLYLFPSKCRGLYSSLCLAEQIYWFVLSNLQFALCMHFLPFCKI